VTDQDPHTTDPDRTRSTARGAELRSELAITDARRAEEETAKAHEAVEQATKQEEQLSGKEQKARARAKAAEEEAERSRKQAEAVAQRAPQAAPGVSGANVASPGLGSNTDPSAAAAASRGSTTARPAAVAAGGAAPATGSDRPEVLVGAAFAGAFVLARVLKRLVD